MLKSFIPLKFKLDSSITDKHSAGGAAQARFTQGFFQRSFDRKLLIRVFLAIICTTILAFSIVAPTYRDFTLSRQNLHDIQQYRLVLDTANFLSAERGPANVVMSEEPSLDSAGMKRLVEFRQRSDAALAQLADVSDVPLGLHNHTVPPDMLQRVRYQLALARSKVDRIAAIPRAALKTAEIQDAIESMFEVSELFRAVIAWNADELVQHDTGLAAPALLGQMLSDLREYGGRAASQIIAPLTTEQRLPPQNVIESRRSQGRLLELWQLINSQNAIYSTPSLIKSRDEIERLFFRGGLDLVDQVIDEGRRKSRYTLTATEFTERFVPTMRPIETYRSEFLDAVVEKFADASTNALFGLAIVVLVTAIVLATLIGIILSVRTHVFRPLMQAHDDVLRLAEDRPIATATRPTQAGEIRDLFQAIEVLQGKLQERASLTRELKVQAETDGLTALLNRRMLDRFAQSSPIGERTNDSMCLILMDIDHFKKVNDTYGHVTGDRVLIQTAELLRSQLRACDLIARFGGEEFAVLVSSNDLSGAVSIARKIRLAMQRETFTTPDGTPFRVTASFGVASGRRGERAWSELIELADTALYRAKSDGRNRVRFARNTLSAPAAMSTTRDNLALERRSPK
ncbi:GGDEF domain-containing protein [Rhizobium sullae]|uniref:diguanylate cyclase n=1 Tax=Rhizobium sullae TaxID=50338 RepID=A0A2N0DDD8_RHISU|nr:GGDEF domain-containing protein [Rhizobium sullae]PKA44125.1 GGDEF domain-containing protein [Rhizobium sullae]UWU14359.1 GGDEF domain-containing protein [Rhizobium sullae]